jgi:hypothetical protein
MKYIIGYLAAILLANLDIVWAQQLFGYSDSVRLGVTAINALAFIAFDLSSRDRLHDAWQGSGLIWKMALLIGAGSVLSWLLNRQAGMIALASFTAFALAGLVDAVAYGLLHRLGIERRGRMNGSNVFSSAVDSLVFPTIAFGGLNLLLTGGQFVAKIAGGAFWAWLFTRHDGID